MESKEAKQFIDLWTYEKSEMRDDPVYVWPKKWSQLFSQKIKLLYT